jgi:hypothetical protein
MSHQLRAMSWITPQPPFYDNYLKTNENKIFAKNFLKFINRSTDIIKACEQ